MLHPEQATMPEQTSLLLHSVALPVMEHEEMLTAVAAWQLDMQRVAKRSSWQTHD